MSRFPRWLTIAVPAAIVVIAISVIAVVAATGNDDDASSSPAPERFSTTTQPTTTTSQLTPFTEPAPPVTDPLPSESSAAAGTVTARIELPSHTLPGGSTMPGTVVVENTGPELQVTTCGDYFTVFLTNEYHGIDDAPRPQCLTSMTIPTGTSRYPVTISSSYASCDEIRGNAYPACLDGGRIPPLPPGEYRTLLLEASSPPVPISADRVAVIVS